MPNKRDPNKIRVQTWVSKEDKKALEQMAKDKGYDTLFPQSKNGKRKKTYTILGHQLQLRSSSSITAPKDIILDLLNLANQRRIDSATLFATPDADHAYAEQLRAEAVKFESLIRTPAPELNKEAATELLKDPDIGPTLEAYGIKSETTDTFKVAFKFTPEAKS